jgi:hypothetical protein
MPATSRVRPALLVAALALLAGGVAWWLRAKPVAPPDQVIEPLERPAATAGGNTSFLPRSEPTGGVFAGIVVDSKGDPVRDAQVLLAGSRNDTVVIKSPILSDDPTAQPPDLEVQQLDYQTVARVQTGADGRFRAAAGDSTVVAIFAVERTHAPGMTGTSPPGQGMKPGADHRVVLPDAGWLKGKVVDAVTKEPIRGADVALNLQARASQGEVPGPEPWTGTNGFAAFQGYVAREIAPLVWDAVPIQGDSAIHRYTQSDGAFTFGPVMSEVQIEVVVTHPDYAWADSDEEVFYPSDNATRKEGEKKVGRKRRLVVPPGKTIEKTYLLPKGEEVKGRVTDNHGQPIPDVEVRLSHVAQYAQHAWYRDHSRNARTGEDGRFRIAGLSFPPYSLHMSHPAFGTADFPGVKAGSDEVYQIHQAGWIEGDVVGGQIDRPLYEAILQLDPYKGTAQRVRMHLTVKDGKFTAKNVAAGKYSATLVAGPWISTPVDLSVESGKPSTYVARLQAGGTISVSAVDGKGAPVDPMTVDLEVVGSDGRALRGAGTSIGRKGVAVATSLPAGRYRARVRAPWFAETLSEPFEVASDATTSIGPLTLRKHAWLRIQSVRDERGGIPQDVRIDLAVAQGQGDFVATRAGDAGLIPVTAGTVRVRAEASDGRRFEQSYEVGEGETVAVDVRISK